MDQSLRRSLAHLVNSCQIKIVSDGFQVYRELINSAFDLIIVDFEIADIDSLELIESIGYIDPGVPVIFLLKEAHQAMWEPARRLNATPLLRPFNPLAFLRLVDKLLHQQLQRYRDLSEGLAAVLDKLAEHPDVSYAFLVDDAGQIVLATCARDDPWLALLGRLAASRGTLTGPLATKLADILPDLPADTNFRLYIATIFENLLLGLLAPASADQRLATEIWQRLEQSTTLIRTAVADNLFVKSSLPIQTQQQVSLPLRLPPESAVTKPESLPARDEVAVNWAIISDNSEVLTRLQRILSGEEA
jgi:CheY-like chemotaxis protein